MSKNILVATCGLVPNVITECFYALSIQSGLKIDQIFVITSLDGSEILENGNSKHDTPPIFGRNGVIAELCEEYGLPLPIMEKAILHDADNRPISDVVSDEQIKAAANTIVSNIRALTQNQNTTLHCVYSGGRRIMAISLGLALTLMARRSDRFYYVRIEPESLLKQPGFFYPAKKNGFADGTIILNEIPILKLGEKYSSIIQPGATYSETVESIQKAISTSKPVVTFEKIIDNDLVYEDPHLMNELIKLEKWSKLEITDMNILLYGERGTGKEGLAKYFSNQCVKTNKILKNFVSVNCAGFVDSTIGPELFGTKKGKYTGVDDSKGLIEMAENGVLFLDEFHHLDFALQPKLLRLLENREFQRLGDSETRKINNLKIVLGMNEKPEDLLEKEELRWDLYDRVSRRISVPALRNRMDFESIVLSLIQKIRKTLKKSVMSVSPEVLQQLKSHRWSGNIREFKNLLEMTIEDLDPNDRILMSLPLDFVSSINLDGKPHSRGIPATLSPIECPMTLEETIREKIELVLRKNNWNITKASTELGKKRTTLQAMMKKLVPTCIIDSNYVYCRYETRTCNSFVKRRA